MDAGAAPADLPLNNLIVVLQRSVATQQAYEQLLQQQQTPGSPQYHHWLTPQQIGEQYGVTPQDIAAVTGWLQSQGLKVGSVSNSRLFIIFGGSAGTVASALSTEFHYYNVQERIQGKLQSQRLLSINTEPKIPAALMPVIQGFTGLSQVPVRPMSRARAVPMSATPQFSSCSGSTCQYFLTPADFATIYDINSVYNAGINGAGVKIAIVGRSRVANSDITEYEGLTGLPTYLPNVIIPPSGTDPGITNDGNQDEATLDVDRSFGTAKGATIDLVVSANTSGGVDGTWIAEMYEVDTLVDPIMSASFGSCEADTGQVDTDAFDTLASQAAGEGISVFVSSGDTGAYGCSSVGSVPPATQTKSPNSLCSTSYVTCVGGTEFNDTANPSQYWSSTNSTTLGSALSYIPEGGWNEPYDATTSSYQLSASGGGVSAYITKPSWQAGTGVSSDGFRDTPDVAFSAAGHDGYVLCLAYNGGDCANGMLDVYDGTSAAAPSMAGVQALVNQKLGGVQGNINPHIYSLAATAPSVFHDTTVATSGVSSCAVTTPSMCNNSTPSPTALTGGLAGYVLTAGYDQVTGWGSVDVANLVNAWSGTTTKYAPSVTLTASAPSILVAETVTFTAGASGSGAVPTGTVQFLSGGISLGAPITLSNGAATTPAESFSATGTYSITAQYSGDSNYNAATSNTFGLMVTAAPPPSFTLSAPALTISAPGATTGNTSTITITDQNGFSGSVSVVCSVVYAGTGTANDLPTCALSNNGSVALSSSTPSATVTATITTTAASSAHSIPFPQPFRWAEGGGVAFACLLFLPVGVRRITFLKGSYGKSLVWSLMLLAVLTVVVGCGGSTSTPTQPANPGTTAGAYTVTITGASGSTTAQTTFTLTVN